VNKSVEKENKFLQIPSNLASGRKRGKADTRTEGPAKKHDRVGARHSGEESVNRGPFSSGSSQTRQEIKDASSKAR